ncbi:hypothetical protein [Bacillus toyonensis]|uniref:hypothetical protein n=1 Tax=Bacillus toyonensis TaxID=155322 RepID=UPI002E1F9176|nr:hypothetical protein [Bacillus toyonensis]
MNYDEMDFKEIEEVLKIKPVDKESLQFKSSYEKEDFDTWEEVEGFLKELKIRAKENYHCFISVLGYEIYMDHYIRVYYHTHISNS